MKKGVSLESAMITLAIFVLIAFSMAFLYNRVFAEGKSVYTQKECQASLLLTESVDKAQPFCIAKISNPIPIKCSREFISIKDQKVFQNARETFYDNTCPDGKKDCLAQNVIARQMATCWSTFFQGQHVVFQQVEEGYLPLLNDEKATACFVCGEITIDKDINGFKQYLKTAQYKSGLDYFTYLSNTTYCYDDYKKDGTCWEGVAKEEGIDQDHLEAGTYAVTFTRIGTSTCSNKVDTTTMTVQLIPMKDISKCNAVIV
jgi:hypothetical protein